MTESEIEIIRTEINDTMRDLFIQTYRLYELEKQFNYDNYGKYPYKDRKTSIQIFADFSVMAYSVNGLFVDESEYIKVYPPLVITRLENVLTRVNEVIILKSSSVLTVSSNRIETYELVEVREFIPIENTTVRTIQYLFPFTATQNLNSTVLSF